ncbi:MAG: hypothetical protein Q4G43_08595 [Mobilicoccus sp.]|nr:hypothetical protein [Mobilicoccus sp.]
MTRALVPALALIALAGCAAVPAGAGTLPTTSGQAHEAQNPHGASAPLSAPTTTPNTDSADSVDSTPQAVPGSLTTTIMTSFEDQAVLASGVVVLSLRPEAYDGPGCTEQECTIISLAIVNGSTRALDPAAVSVAAGADRRDAGEPVAFDVDAEGMNDDGLIEPGGHLVLDLVLARPADADWVVDLLIGEGDRHTSVVLTDGPVLTAHLGAVLSTVRSHPHAVWGDDPATIDLPTRLP